MARKALTLKSVYLVGYNLASAAGWIAVLTSVLMHVAKSGTLFGDASELWKNVGETLTLVQTAAALEMAHSLFGIVRSPFMTTFLQVASRLLLVHAYTRTCADAQSHWSLTLMVGSWALVEIPRYFFYTFAQVFPSHEIPAALYWLRYSLFIVLYPTGITGEWLQMLATAPHQASGAAVGPSVGNAYLWGSETAYTITTIVFFGYFLGGPFMISNMWSNRKRAFRNRSRALNPRPIQGVQWPVTDASTGARSTLTTNKAIWQAAMAAVDMDDRVKRTRSWRRNYHKWVNRCVQASCESPKAALGIARAGLKACAATFQYVESAGDAPVSLADAFEDALAGDRDSVRFDTLVFEGNERSAAKIPEVGIPYAGASGKPYYKYKNKATRLTGEELRKQLDKWVAYGTLEKDCADAVKRCIDEPEKFVDLKDLYFVILGATSAMGPIDVLLSHGATVIAVDLDREGIWRKLLGMVRKSPGRIIFPVKRGAATPDTDKNWDDFVDAVAPVAGSNLLAQAPHIARWLVSLIGNHVPENARLAVGNYTYLDGELHVRLSVSCNAIIEALCDAAPQTKVCFLCTPTDCHLIPKEAWDAAGSNHRNAPFWQKVAAGLGVLGLKPNQMKPVNGFYMVDGIVPQQGPNYALAKRMQHWMAIDQREKGHAVASNVAPSTATISVTHNVLFKWAYGGMHFFRPMEVFFQETSNALMGALLMHDISHACKGAASPKTKLKNPLELFARQSAHGGLWRTGYALNSTAVTTVLAHLISSNLGGLFFVAAAAVAGASFFANADVAAFDPLARVLESAFIARIM